MQEYQSYPQAKLKKTGLEHFGEIPEDWRCLRGKFLFRNRKDTEQNASKILSLTLDGVVERDPEENEGLQPGSFDNYQIFNEGDLVFKLIDLENRSTSRVGIVPEQGMMSPSYIRLIKDSSQVNERYFYYQYYDFYCQYLFEKFGDSAVRSSLSADDLLNIAVLVPPVEDQEKIASFLDEKLSEVDGLIEKKRRLIDLLKEKRQALINRAVTQGLDDDVAMKDSGVGWLGEIPNSWKSGQLKFFCTRVADYGDTIGSDEYIDDGLRFIRTTDITEHNGLKSEGVHIDPEITGKRVEKNDLLFTRSGSVGTSYIHKGTEPLGFASYLVRFRPNCSELDPNYLYYFTNSKVFEDWIGLEASQTTMDNISGDKFARMPMLCPPLNEQEEIVEYLENKTEKIDAMIEKNEEAIEKLEEYKESLIHHAVTGKIDVRNFDSTGEE